MQIIEDKALLLRLKNPDPVLACIEKSRLLKQEDGISQVLVKWGIDEAQALKKLQIKNVPSAILRDYEWTGFHKPMGHQKETSSFLSLH